MIRGRCSVVLGEEPTWSVRPGYKRRPVVPVLYQKITIHSYLVYFCGRRTFRCCRWYFFLFSKSRGVRFGVIHESTLNFRYNGTYLILRGRKHLHMGKFQKRSIRTWRYQIVPNSEKDFWFQNSRYYTNPVWTFNDSSTCQEWALYLGWLYVFDSWELVRGGYLEVVVTLMLMDVVHGAWCIVHSA